MDKTERLNELNKKAIYSGFSGQPVVFVSKISRGMRRAKDGVYSDGETIYDGYADEEGDITAMFVVTNTGSAVELGEMFDLPSATVRTKLLRARQLLKKEMSP